MIHKKLFYYCLICISIFFCQSVKAQVKPQTREIKKIVISKEKFHIYLLIGQSNMAGRGIIEAQDTLGNERILRLNRNGDWDVAKEPLHFDKPEAGVGPGLSFAKELLKTKDEDVVIGLIPCAAGGSGISIWLEDKFWSQTNSYPYNNMLLRTKLALKDGMLKGILWHQGESDASDKETAALYKNRLKLLIQQLRTTFENPNLPFIAGELPSFNEERNNINPILYELKNEIPYFDVVSGENFKALSDKIHLDAPSARELGKRYAKKMKSVSEF